MTLTLCYKIYTHCSIISNTVAAIIVIVFTTIIVVIVIIIIIIFIVMAIFIIYTTSLNDENCIDLLPFIGRLVDVYHQERTTDKYLYEYGLPAMTEMSLCFWMKLEADDDNRTRDWLLSIAWPGEHYIHMCVYI